MPSCRPPTAASFGARDILINEHCISLEANSPFFFVAGSESTNCSQFYVDDLAELVRPGVYGNGCTPMDAVGPETFSFRELVDRDLATDSSCTDLRPLLPVPTDPLPAGRAPPEPAPGDVLLTRHEIEGLMAGLLSPPSRPGEGLVSI